ncbi:IS5 family transposase, partial [Porphyromonas gulae]|uniref:IS5 family transposase n=1 Tax=Porphyromonas gulae TaxID=111105 RepID=UPI00190FA2C8
MATKPTEPAPSFLQVYTQVRRDRMKHSFLRQINACVDWRGIRTLLNKKYTKTQNAVGNPAYDALLMFKILLLETWYGLSDYEVQERINDSLLFSEFLGLDLGFPSPDHSTISRFRTELTHLGIMDKLLGELNKQFKKHGISRIDQGAIVDAGIVDSPYSPRSQDALDQEAAYHYELKRGKPGVDSEARWVRKGKHYRYGYKKHVLTDEQGLVEALIRTPSNCADTLVLPELVEKSELSLGVSVLADKGYCSKKNSEYLAR